MYFSRSRIVLPNYNCILIITLINFKGFTFKIIKLLVLVVIIMSSNYMYYNTIII